MNMSDIYKKIREYYDDQESQMAIDHFHNGNYKEAEELFTKAEIKIPGDKNRRLFMGLCDFYQEQYDSAYSFFMPILDEFDRDLFYIKYKRRISLEERNLYKCSYIAYQYLSIMMEQKKISNDQFKLFPTYHTIQEEKQILASAIVDTRPEEIFHSYAVSTLVNDYNHAIKHLTPQGQIDYRYFHVPPEKLVTREDIHLSSDQSDMWNVYFELAGFYSVFYPELLEPIAVFIVNHTNSYKSLYRLLGNYYNNIGAYEFAREMYIRYLQSLKDPEKEDPSTVAHVKKIEHLYKM